MFVVLLARYISFCNCLVIFIYLFIVIVAVNLIIDTCGFNYHELRMTSVEIKSRREILIKYKKMLIVLGSTVALIASLMAYSKSQSYWTTVARKIYHQMQYSLLGLKENFIDLLQAKYNKTGEKIIFTILNSIEYLQF